MNDMQKQLVILQRLQLLEQIVRRMS
jgi:hypothetical protein